MTPFGEKNMMRSPLTQWLTAGRFMRALFGVAKACAFVYLAGLYAYELPGGEANTTAFLYEFAPWNWLGWFLVWTSVVLTVVRALPVIFDAVAYIGTKEQPAEAAEAAPSVESVVIDDPVAEDPKTED
jgi:hypothetical protein